MMLTLKEQTGMKFPLGQMNSTSPESHLQAQGKVGEEYTYFTEGFQTQ